MRKVLFLMFLLLLMGLGAAGVRAQVRIGGNTAPSKAAVLDLNATDAANTGTGGLVLPRVNLTDTLMQLTTGNANLTGMLVYNTSAAIPAGVYSWDGRRWVMGGLPFASAADSDKYLMWNGSAWVLTYLLGVDHNTPAVGRINRNTPVTWALIVDTVITEHTNSRAPYTIKFDVNLNGAFCYNAGGAWPWIISQYNYYVTFWTLANAVTADLILKCYRCNKCRNGRFSFTQS